MYSNGFVCLMGIGTVFFGLTCLILLTYFMSFLSEKSKKKEAAPPGTNGVSATSESHHPDVIAAISAALAEELGSSVSGVRILSLKKL